MFAVYNKHCFPLFFHQFNPVSPLEEENEYYVKAPTPSDTVHCLVSAIPADKLPMMNANKNDEANDIFKKMRAIRLVASNIGNKVLWNIVYNI